jgi:glucan 1,3-beta-glucosidase
VYLPSGVYIISKPIQLYVGTVLMGDPLSPPTIKAASGFNGNTLIYGKDPNQGSTINFYIGVKNLVFDSNNINKDTTFTIIDWSVSQATQLTNCVFNMPSYSSGHTGISMPEGGSGTYLGDLQINGGVVGIDMSNQQYMVKGVTFQYSTTGIKLSHCFDCIIQDCTFLDHNVAIDMTSNSVGSLVVLDSSAQDVGTMVATVNTGNGASSLILENVQNNGAGAAMTVVASGNSILSGNVADTWVMGNTVRNPVFCSKLQLTSEVHTRGLGIWKLCWRCNFHHASFVKSSSKRQILHHGASHLSTVRSRSVYQHQIRFWISRLR